MALIRTVLGLMAAVFLIAAPVQAQLTEITGPSSSSTDPTIDIQSQHYLAVIRKDKSVAVFASLHIPNASSSTIDSFTFQIPKAKPTNLAIYQNHAIECDVNGCHELDDLRSQEGTTSTESQYEKATFTASGESYTVKLPYKVKPKKTLYLVVSYLAKEYITGNTIAFDSFKLPAATDWSEINIDAEQDGVVFKSVTTEEESLSDEESASLVRNTKWLDQVTSAISKNAVTPVKATDEATVLTIQSLEYLFNYGIYGYRAPVRTETKTVVSANTSISAKGEFTGGTQSSTPAKSDAIQSEPRKLTDPIVLTTAGISLSVVALLLVAAWIVRRRSV